MESIVNMKKDLETIYMLRKGGRIAIFKMRYWIGWKGNEICWMYKIDKSDWKSIDNVKFILDVFKKNTCLVNYKIIELMKLCAYMYFMFIVVVPKIIYY